jgi:signal transduction histidine kinase
MTHLFVEARRRLAFRYLALFALVLVLFSAAFYVAIAVVIQPAFDIGPEPAEGAGARAAYVRTVERIAIVVVAADIAVVAAVAVAGWYLADRTLRPVRDAHERQGRFVADASHEIRSPLAVIRATVDRALDPAADERTREEALVTIGEAVDRLTATTRGLLTLAAVEAPARGSRDVVDVSVAVAEAVAAARASAGPDAGRRLEVSLEPDLLIRGDSEVLTTLVRNLVDNAFRYAPRGAIVVRAERSTGSAVVEVADHGPGIAQADLERIFEPFYRVRADAKAPPGTGLGLAIAARLARELGGRLQVESTVGSGSTFRLTLPRAR